ncbi:MAG: MarC family protein [Spirochaetales bacterium]|nr:MarC family protein [Spirochaetales bacterium]
MNMEIWINAFLALFAILSPVGIIPIYADLTEDLDKKSRFAVFNTAVLTGFVTLVVFTFTGRWVMSRVFQIDILEFRIAGGILLTVLSVKHIVLSDKKEVRMPNKETARQQAMEIGVVPMAVPLLVGPGSIVTGILLLDRDGPAVTITVLVAVFLVCWIMFQLTPWISRIMGKIGRMVISRVLWIFLCAIGVHFLLSGIRETFGI